MLFSKFKFYSGDIFNFISKTIPYFRAYSKLQNKNFISKLFFDTKNLDPFFAAIYGIGKCSSKYEALISVYRGHKIPIKKLVLDCVSAAVAGGHRKMIDFCINNYDANRLLPSGMHFNVDFAKQACLVNAVYNDYDTIAYIIDKFQSISPSYYFHYKKYKKYPICSYINAKWSILESNNRYETMRYHKNGVIGCEFLKVLGPADIVYYDFDDL